MSFTGRIVEVSTVDAGDALLVDHPAGATALSVGSLVDFEGVEQVALIDDADEAGTTYLLGLLGYDEMTETLTLASPLPVAFEAGTSVVVWPLSPERQALVMLDDGTEPVSCAIAHHLVDYIAEGTRGPDEQEVVTVDDEGELTVVDVLGLAPSFDGSNIIPETIPIDIPEPYEPPPLTAPTVSPIIETVAGLPSSVVIVTAPVRPEDEIEVHMSTDEAFVPVVGDGATLAVPSTKATVVNVAALPVSSAPLDPAATYYFRVIARNAAGSAPPSPAVVGECDSSAVEAVIAAKLIAGFILAGQITVGGITIHPDTGITIAQPGGNVIRFPSDSDEFAEITGHLVAKTLSVEGNMSIDAPVQINGPGKLGDGISAPKTPPTISAFWESMSTTLGYDFGDTYYGLSNYIGSSGGAVDTTWIVTAQAFYGAKPVLIDRTTGATWGFIDLSGTWGPNFNPVGGVISIGAHYYFLGYDVDRGNAWYFYKVDWEWNKVGELLWCPASSLNARPIIGRNDAGQIVVAFTPTSSSMLTIHRRNAGTMALESQVVVSSAAQNPTGAAAALNLSSVVEGALDTGATRIFIGSHGLKKVIAYTGPAGDGTMVRQDAYSFDTAGVNPKGVLFDKADPLNGVGRFLSLSPNGVIHKYGGYPLATNATATSTYADLDPTGGTHETAPSPPAALTTIPARTKIRITAQQSPDAAVTDPLKTDKANRVRIYAAYGAGTRYLLQPDLAAGVRSGTYDRLPTSGTAAPAIVTDFSALDVDAGSLSSTGLGEGSSPAWEVVGDGSWRFGGMSGIGPVGGFPSHVIAPDTATLAATTSTVVLAGSTLNVPCPGPAAVYVVQAIFDVEKAAATAGAWTGYLQVDGVNQLPPGILGGGSAIYRMSTPGLWFVTGLAAGTRVFRLVHTASVGSVFNLRTGNVRAVVQRIY